MSQFKKLAGQTAIYGFGSVVPRILNYILLTPFYTRVLTSISDYGTHTYLYSYGAFLIILLTFGMETTFFRYAKSKGIEKVFTTSFVFLFINAFLFSIIILFNADRISQLIGIIKVEYLYYFLGIISLDVISAIPFATLRYNEKARLFAFLKIINVLVNISVNLFYLWLIPLLISTYNWDFSMIYDSQNLLEYTFKANLIANIITFLMLIPNTRKYYSKFDVVIFKEMFFYSAPILISGILGMINEVADKILLKYLLPKNISAFEQIGIYSANYKIAALITIFNSMFRYALEPFFFKVYGYDESKSRYAIISKYYLIFGLFILLIVNLFIDVFKYFISENYHSGLHIVPVVLLANLLFGMYYTMAVWYKVTDKTYFSAIFALIGSTVTILANIIMIPLFGYTGSAFATLLCYFVMFILTVYFGQKHYPINYNYGYMLKLALFSMLVFIVGNYLPFDNLYLKFSFNAVLLIAYIIFVVFTNREIHDKIFNYGKH